MAHHQSRHSAQPLPCHSAQPLPCHSARQSQNPETTPTPNEPCSSDNPILSTQDLTIGYGTKAVATNLFIDIPQGKSTIITGPNGSGKTTLALTLAGLLPPLSGKVIASDNLAGSSLPHPHTWSSKELLTRIGTVFQSPEHQFVAGTVFDEIAIGLKARGEKRGREPLSRRAHDPKENIEEKVNSLLDEFHLTHLGRANPFTLSGGEKRRLSVATVLAANPQVIILDEPTFGQDYLTWQAMVSMVESLRDQGTTIISVTHDQAYLDTLGDHHINLGER
ncbi:MAG: energy-coupling factor ABC transporter ATP-binding protein [Propionibacteriaceae bacterium]|nr:energy-coupling factor ABC transporter ATP-binding protein [Propionibacteriaceae bacterium]